MKGALTTHSSPHGLSGESWEGAESAKPQTRFEERPRGVQGQVKDGTDIEEGDFDPHINL